MNDIYVYVPSNVEGGVERLYVTCKTNDIPLFVRPPVDSGGAWRVKSR